MLLLLLACAGPPAETPADTTPDAPSDDTVDTREPVTRDTAGTFDTDVARDTWTPHDAPIGATALDGAWTGTFVLTEEVALAGDRPQCAGTITVTIDGQAARHVVSSWDCPLWDPNIDLLPGALDAPYGAVTGVGFATLDPADLTRFRLDLSMVATAMIPLELRRVLFKQVGEDFEISYDDIAGIGALRAGHKLEGVLSRTVAP